MGRVTVWVPDELEAAVRDARLGLNWSATMQAGLVEALGCTHGRGLRCVVCGDVVDRHGVEVAAVDRFWRDELAALEDLVAHGGTAEGACRVAQQVARRWECPTAGWPLPRPTRVERERNAWEACHTRRVS